MDSGKTQNTGGTAVPGRQGLNFFSPAGSHDLLWSPALLPGRRMGFREANDGLGNYLKYKQNDSG